MAKLKVEITYEAEIQNDYYPDYFIKKDIVTATINRHKNAIDMSVMGKFNPEIIVEVIE
jgi:hypothetical protein